MSKEEDIFAKKMNEIFVGWQIIRNWRPNKLNNIKTGRNLEIDYYIGKYAIGFEYQGGIHFKNIKRFRNDSDKSRYNDLLKYELIENDTKRKKKKLTIVEIFDCDLNGNFKENLIKRVENSIEYYTNKNALHNARNLIYLLCFIESGIKYKQENVLNRLIPFKYIRMNKIINSKFSQLKRTKTTI